MPESVPESTELIQPVNRWLKHPHLISIVCPVFLEEAGISRFAEELLQVMDKLGLPFEVIFVEDDSPDRSLEVLRGIHEKRPKEIKVLSLSRRFGHQASLAAGFQHANGDVVICMDSDLQHPPSLLPLLLWKWSMGYQLVYTRRRGQKGRGFLKESASRWFYKVMDMMSDISFEEGTADFRLMDRAVVDALNRFGERTLLYRGLINWIGFRRTALDYNAVPRAAGSSSYSWRRMLMMGIDGLFAFSLLPLRFSYYIGALALFACVTYGAWSVFSWMRGATKVAGYTSLVLMIGFVGSLNLICLGIVGEYIGRIHEQVKNRPLYLVKESIGIESAAERYPKSEVVRL